MVTGGTAKRLISGLLISDSRRVLTSLRYSKEVPREDFGFGKLPGELDGGMSTGDVALRLYFSS